MQNALTGHSVPGLESVQSELEQVRSLMGQQVHTLPVPDDIEPLLTYLEQRIGKLIRPGLVCLAGHAVGAPPLPGLIRVAAIMEMIHAATLLHDDVIDQSDKRRGEKTANHCWGNETAVLLGDFVLTHVFRMCVELDRPIAQVVADTAAQVCRGELLQTLDPDGHRLNEARYLEVISDKSAAFFSGCCQAGALLCGASKEQLGALSTYGLEIGVAFQMADDLIDVCGSESHAGKPVGQDVNSHLTLPVIHWLGTLPPSERSQIDLNNVENLLDRLKQAGSLAYVQEKCREATENAIEALTAINDSPAKTGLTTLAHYAGNRSS